MAIHYLERHEIDIEKWDACLASHPATDSLFARSWYLDVACEQWSALILDDYVTLMPLPWRKKYGIAYVYPPFFLPRLGIFGNDISSDDFQKWMFAISKKFKWIDIVLQEQHYPINTPNTCFHHASYVLDCNRSYEELRKGYHQNHKRNCQKASERDLKSANNFSTEEAITLFRENQEKLFKVGYKDSDYARLIRIIDTLSQYGHIEKHGVCDAEGKLCAAAFFPFLNGKYYFLFSGRNAESNCNSAMFFLIDTFIKEHAGQAITLDFNGSDNEKLAQFYAGFGAKEMQFPQIQISRLHFCLKKLFALYRKLR
ncbi:MAG: hypothetical protein RBS13_04270 [Bacteroidales bacterium]|jgi:hypothetical protein|nr:hypothetical protein [Bacteroidales bacterium]